MRLWHWLTRRRTSTPETPTPCVNVMESPAEILKDVRHARELREHRERMQQLSDELSLIQRDEGPNHHHG